MREAFLCLFKSDYAMCLKICRRFYRKPSKARQVFH